MVTWRRKKPARASPTSPDSAHPLRVRLRKRNGGCAIDSVTVAVVGRVSVLLCATALLSGLQSELDRGHGLWSWATWLWVHGPGFRVQRVMVTFRVQGSIMLHGAQFIAHPSSSIFHRSGLILHRSGPGSGFRSRVQGMGCGGGC
eukprot:3230703-Rhodomonas_salina.1